jgi:hypothetical protein
MVTTMKYHSNQIKAFHFLKIAYKKPRCPIPYEKNLKTNFYEWFTKRGEVKTKDAHVIELGT